MIFVELLKSNKANITTILSFGILTFLYGFGIYYLMPLSLLKIDFKLLLLIFFSILLGIILGVTLLSINAQPFLEKILIYLLLFFEKKSIRSLVLNNLSAHRIRNKLTSMIFSLSITFVIFIIVTYNTQANYLKVKDAQRIGRFPMIESKHINSL